MMGEGGLMNDHDLVASVDTLAAIRGELGRSPLSRSARRTYYGALQHFETWRGGRAMTRLLIEEYAAYLLAQGQTPATVRHHQSALTWWARRVADLAAEEPGLDPARRAEIVYQAERAATARKVAGNSPQQGRHVSAGEIRALLQACVADAGPAGSRDAAMIAVAFSTGMRRAELCALDLGDVAPIPEGYELTIRHAKGNKTRAVTVYNGARDYLRDWLAVRGHRPGALFLACKGGAILPHGLGVQSLHERLLRRAAQAGVTNITWHDARRTLAGELLDGGADLATVQRILGHASPVTTANYDRRPEETRRKALRAMHVPYLRKGGA